MADKSHELDGRSIWSVRFCCNRNDGKERTVEIEEVDVGRKMGGCSMNELPDEGRKRSSWC